MDWQKISTGILLAVLFLLSLAEALRQSALFLIDNLGYVDQESGKMKFSY